MLQLPIDTVKLILSYDECVGFWIGLSLRMTCKFFGSVVSWATMQTGAGRACLLRALQLYSRKEMMAFPSWLISARMNTLFDSAVDVDLAEIGEAAVQRDDHVLLDAAYGSLSLIPENVMIGLVKFAVTNRALRVTQYLAAGGVTVFDAAVIEAVCSENDVIVDMLDHHSISHGSTGTLKHILHVDVTEENYDQWNDPTLLADFTAAVIRCDNGRALKRLIACNAVNLNDTRLFLTAGRNCMKCLADVVGVSLLSYMDWFGRSLSYLSAHQAIEYMTRASPQQSHLFEAAAANPDIEVFRWAARRWPGQLPGAVVTAVEKCAHPTHAMWVLSEFGHRLSQKSWVVVVKHFLERGETVFNMMCMRFRDSVMDKGLWNRVPITSMLQCPRVMRWVAESDLLHRRQYMDIVALHAPDGAPLPDVILQRVRGDRLIFLSLLHAIGKGYHENAEWMLGHTQWAPERMASRRRRIVIAALNSLNPQCLRWTLATFAGGWTSRQRRNVVADMHMFVPMVMQHVMIFE